MRFLATFAIGCIGFLVAVSFIGYIPTLLLLALTIGLTVRR